VNTRDSFHSRKERYGLDIIASVDDIEAYSLHILGIFGSFEGSACGPIHILKPSSTMAHDGSQKPASSHSLHHPHVQAVLGRGKPSWTNGSYNPSA